MKSNQIISIIEFINDSINQLIDWDMGCCHYPLDNNYGIIVGWENGFDANDNSIIHSNNSPTWGIVVGIKVLTSDDLKTDFEFLNFPYLEDGRILAMDFVIHPDENLEELVRYILEEYNEVITSYTLVDYTGLVKPVNK